MAFGGRLSKGAIVFDVGSVYLKYGFAGESSPRHIMKWKVCSVIAVSYQIIKDVLDV